MDWIKHNLVLVVSGLAALALLGGAGFYFYSKMAKERQVNADIEQVRTSLADYQSKDPFPSKKNLTQVEQNEQKLREFMARANRFFGTANFSTNQGVTNAQFNVLLLSTIDQMQNVTRIASVSLPTNFCFGFTAQRDLLQFDPASQPALTAQLADIKILVELLCRAKVYALVGVRRAPVSTNDNRSLATQPQDYLASKKMVTNDTVKAVLSPYEISFKCSTAELAAVLEGCATNHQGFLVQSIRVDPAEPPGTEVDSGFVGGINPMMPMMMRYGFGRSRGPMSPMGPAAPVASAAAPRSGSTGIILKEKPLKVFLLVEAIKLQATP